MDELDYKTYQGDIDLVDLALDEKLSTLEVLTGDIDISDF